MCRKPIFPILSIVVLVFCAEPLSSRARADLIGYWKLDETSGTVAADSAGADNDGTLVGDQLEWRPADGRSGGALYCSGLPDAHVEFSTAGMSTTAGTVALWGWLADPQPAQTRYFFGETGIPPWNNRVQLYMDDGNTELDLGLGDSHSRKTNVVVLETETWYHIAVTWDSGNYVVYVNGEEADAGQYTGLTQFNDVADIGNDGRSDATGRTEAFGGLIDEVRVYDHALNAAEIQAIMQIAPLPKASGPNPKDGALHLETWANLEWRAGDFAVSHDVYIGDNYDDVNDGTGDTFQGNQTETSMLVGFPGFPIPDGFVPGATYYWRIDEVNDADPNSPWKGNVWSFSLPPKTAYFPDPPDGAEFVDPNATFSWTAGDGAKLHTFYIGDSFDEVNNATGGTMSGTTRFDPGPLELEKVYYWRVDEFDGLETYKGDVWAFTTPGAAGNSRPANGAVDVQMIGTLSWTAADNATSHELYFGTDAEAVNNATTASPEYVGPRALGAESYDPGGLDWKSSYAWRVDEVYPTGTVKGLVWTFTTADFITVDDVESYDDIDPLPGEPGLNRIFDKWIDGFGTTTNGALVSNDLPPYAETTIVHGGAQSMIYRYDNNLKTSEATLTLVYPTDWTEGGVAKLALWFRGASANAADRLFIALNGTAVVYHDNPAATQMTGWNQWVIDLQAFADQGVNLANVSTITIGIGTKNSPAAGGTGTMYFDDIRLYR